MKERLDKILPERKLCSTRSQARELIESGIVEVNGVITTKTAQMVSPSDKIVILAERLYVGRGAKKLIQALDVFKINVSGKVAADIGASTGGFTQVLLENNIKKVYAIDVGHDQLDPLIKNNPKVVDMPGVNAKFPLKLLEKIDIAVVDLSFISLKLVLRNIANILKPDGDIIILIKPQFEAGKERLGKGGVIRDDNIRQEVFNEILDWMAAEGYKLIAHCDSPIIGKDGNSEYLAHVKI